MGKRTRVVTLHMKAEPEVDPTLGLLMKMWRTMEERNHSKKSSFSVP